MAVIRFEGQSSGEIGQAHTQTAQTDDIGQLINTTRTLRDEARALGLKHEAYLLHLALLALADRAKSEG